MATTVSPPPLVAGHAHGASTSWRFVGSDYAQTKQAADGRCKYLSMSIGINDWLTAFRAGMSVALGIMAIEWALFLLLAWYLEQVLPSGRHLRAFQMLKQILHLRHWR